MRTKIHKAKWRSQNAAPDSTQQQLQGTQKVPNHNWREHMSQIGGKIPFQDKKGMHCRPKFAMDTEKV
jgi:hypothetical protein